MFTVKGGINLGGTNESVYEVAASTRGSIQVTSTLVRGNRELKFGYVSTSSNVEIWMAYDGTYRGVTEVEVSSSVNFTLTMTETTTKPSGFVEGFYRILAATADNVASATKLQTPRTIWGQSFDGTGNVSGSLSEVGNIHFKVDDSYDIGSDAAASRYIYTHWLGARSGRKLELGANNSGFGQGLCIDTNLNVGIGTNSPAYKLHVVGDIYSSDRVIANNSVLSNKLYSSTTPNNTENKCIEIAGNTIREYHSGANPYHSDIILNYDSLSFSAYGTIDITANQGGITLGTGGSIKLSSAGGFNITYRGAHFSVSQTNGSEYTWSMDSIKAKGNILATGGITAYSSSDIRLKQDLRKLDYFGIIKAMGGTFGFAWKKDNTRSIGWIAQHVLCNPHLKDIVDTDEKGYYKINYWSPKLIATAFGAIEQVGDEVSRLKARVVFLESEVQRLSGDKDGNNKKRLDNKNINSLN